jgi:hypothetical protein
MKSQLKFTLLAVVSLVAAVAARADTTFGENPAEPWWYPVSPSPNGTHVYANSFVASAGGDVVSLGTWLNTLTEDPTTTLMFQILGSVGGNVANGPDMAAVIASTGPVGGMTGALAYYSGAVASGALTAGDTYWFAINAIGGGGGGSYQTARPAGNFDGTGSFWYSNSHGQFFDGQNLTPEFAFSVTVSNERNGNNVPDSANTLALLAGALVTAAAVRRRLALKA